MPTHYYAPIGQCIYCGEKQPRTGISRLGDEHIIPFSLAGTLILPESSCAQCAHIINKQVENPIMREEWGYFRAKYKLPTRNKAGRKDKIKMRRHDGSKMAIPIADYSAPVPIYRFKQARALSGFGEKDNARAWTMSILTDSEKEVALQQKYSQWNQQHQFKTQPYEFARLIAKIGYGYATAEVGFGSFDPLVTDIILGKSDDYFYFVGGDYLVGDGDILPPRAGGNHLLDIEIRFVGSGRALVVVGVRLFSASSTPRYHAVVGVVDFGNEEHAHRFEQHRLAGKMKVVPFTGIQAP